MITTGHYFCQFLCHYLTQFVSHCMQGTYEASIILQALSALLQKQMLFEGESRPNKVHSG